MTCLECSSPDLQPVELTDHRLITCARCGATFKPTEDGIRLASRIKPRGACSNRSER